MSGTQPLLNFVKYVTELDDLIKMYLLDYNLTKVCDAKESIVDSSSSIKTPVNNAYSILGLQSTAPLSEINRSYWRLPLASAKQKFKKLKDAIPRAREEA
jgi:hypothetical protein